MLLSIFLFNRPIFPKLFKVRPAVAKVNF